MFNLVKTEEKEDKRIVGKVYEWKKNGENTENMIEEQEKPCTVSSEISH